MSLTETLTKWTSIFVNDWPFVRALSSQMHNENKLLALRNIYRVSKYKIHRDHLANIHVDDSMDWVNDSVKYVAPIRDIEEENIYDPEEVFDI